MTNRCMSAGRRVAAGLGAVVLVWGTAVLAAAAPAVADSLVNLSGTVRIGATAAAGASVSYGGVSTTADANGHYLLHPFSGTSAPMTISFSVLHGSVPVTVGGTDMVEDVTFPTAPATGIVHVVDGDGNALANQQVTGAIVPEPDQTASGATTDGAPLTWGFGVNAPLQTQAVCTTDGTGACSFPTLLHLRGQLQTTVSHPYGSDSSYPSTFSATTTATVESDPTTTTLTVDWTHSLVTLSGTVTIGGAAAAGAAVQFAGLSTTTDANGHYALHPFQNTSDTLVVNKGAYSFHESFAVLTDDATADVDIPAQAAGVQLSGVATIGSAPAAGATVTLGGLSTTADNSGHYVLHPFPGTVGTIMVTSGVLHGSAPITIGNGDQVDDVNIPTGPLTVNVHVLDGDGNPIPNLQVLGAPVSSTSSTTGLTSDGSTVTWGITWPGPPQPVCTTNASGTCSFSSLLNLDGTVTATVNAPYGNDHSYPSSFSASVTGSASTGPADLTLTVDWVHTLVTLSGTITIGGTPAAHAAVTYGNLSTTTDANGHYAVHPFAGTSGELDITSGLIHGTAPVTLGSTDQTADVDLPPGDIVHLSGTVLIGSVPDALTTVSFGGVSTTADSAGRYQLDAFPNSSGTLTTNDGIVYSSASITVGGSDQQEDVTIPTGPTTATVITVDGSGNPLPGQNVHLVVPTTPSPVTGTTTSGATITWGVKMLDQPITRDCTTGADGSCTFQGLLNIVGTVSASKQLVAGDSSYPTLHASHTGTAPVDGAPLTLAFPNVAYVPSAGTVPGSVLVTTQGSGSIANPVTTAVPTSLLPAGTSAPVGAVGYTVHDVPVGGSLDVYVQLPPGTVPTAIDKLVNGALVDVSSIATISGNTITLHLTDGGLGDADGVANGTIVDPVVPITGAVGTKAQTITFPTVPAKTYGAKPFAVLPKASSHLAVSVTSESPSVCSASSNTVAVVGAGVCTLTAHQPGSGAYAAAPAVTRSVTIAPKGLTVTPASVQRVYGVADPAFAVKYSGFVNGESAATAFTGAPHCVSDATGSSAPGKYTVTCTSGSLSAPNYTFAFKTAKLTITQAVLTLKADDESRSAGAPNPALTFSVSGFNDGETLATSDVTGSPSCTTTAKPASHPGTYKISCAKGTLASADYKFVFGAGTMTVT